MSKIKSLCGKCSNNCQDGFTLFTSEGEAGKLAEKYTFFKIVKSGTDVVGKTKRVYHVVKCDRLQEDGKCVEYPENAPAWCKIKS